jgi:hypothetical protein
MQLVDQHVFERRITQKERGFLPTSTSFCTGAKPSRIRQTFRQQQIAHLIILCIIKYLDIADNFAVSIV